eukprot:maker-scaffold1209_size55568-snap-gene-0.9 protein:Tk03738 transcript:maker-scaffold1209_size55568-snap-gene-0.9-mRNA-1 annotation:"ras-related protein rab-24"
MSPMEMKVVLLGTEYCGKSCLVERFLYDRFRGQNLYQNTIGAAYGAKRFDTDVDGTSRTLIMGIWDTAGSERYQAMSKLYYRSARAAILCFDVGSRESWAKLQFWRREVQRHESMCKIYLCGTKVDTLEREDKERAVDPGVLARFAQECEADLFETSSKTGSQVEDMFKKIAMDYITDARNQSLSDYDGLVDINRQEAQRRKLSNSVSPQSLVQEDGFQFDGHVCSFRGLQGMPLAANARAKSLSTESGLCCEVVDTLQRALPVTKAGAQSEEEP